MTSILGISAFFHDSAAALIVDGKIVAAAQEERFTRKKHDPSFPENAILFSLAQARISLSEIDFVVFYDKPFLKFERLLETYVAFAPRGFQSFKMAIPLLYAGYLIATTAGRVAIPVIARYIIKKGAKKAIVKYGLV